MSNEHTPRDTQKDDAMFAELIKQARRHEDVGIAEFETHAIEVVDRLKEEYISFDTSITDLDDSEDTVYEDDLDESLADALTDLTGEWMHAGDRVTVSGHLYVTDVYMATFNAPEEWGERIKDDNEPGSYYYAVQDVELRSAGIEIVPQYDLDASALINLKGVYEFIMPEDEEGRIVVFAGIGDLVDHTYEMPTPQEAISYLETNYQEECVLLDKAITPDGEATLLERLRKLMIQLQGRFAESEMFVKSVEQYVQHFLNFSPKESHSLVIGDRFKLFAGSNFVIQGEKELMWPEYSFSRPFLIKEANEPEVHFSRQPDGSVECYIQVLRYNDEKGSEDPEYIRVALDSIVSFRSNRALRPLLTFLVGGDIELSKGNDDLFEIDNDGNSEGTEVREVAQVSAAERLISDLEAFEAELQHVIEKLSRASKRLYDTPEEAMAACYEFNRKEMSNLFELFQLSPHYELTLSGEGVSRVNASKNVTTVSEESTGIYNLNFAFHSDEEVFASLEPGQSIQGMLQQYFVGVEHVDDEEAFETEKYRIKPALVFSERIDQDILAMVNGVELLSAQYLRSALVKLDGSAEVTIPLLERYRESQSKIDTFAQVDSLAPVVDLMNQLQETVINAMALNNYVPFDKIELFNLLDTLVKDEELEPGVVTAAMAAVEALIIDRIVKYKGEMFVKNLEDGRYIPLTNGESGAFLHGQVMDIRNDIEGNDLFIVIQDPVEDGLIYVRARTITELHF